TGIWNSVRLWDRFLRASGYLGGDGERAPGREALPARFSQHGDLPSLRVDLVLLFVSPREKSHNVYGPAARAQPRAVEPGTGAFAATMTLAIILVTAAILSLVLIVAIASRTLQLSGGSNLIREIEPIDVEAFRNLINVADDAFLRESLAPKQFRAVRRARLRATAAYVSQAGRNAVVLVHIGQAALTSSDLRTQ